MSKPKKRKRKLLPLGPLVMWAVHARDVVRKTNKDPGRLAVWVVLAPTAEEAAEKWMQHNHSEWLFESVSRHPRAQEGVVRVL